MYRKPTDTGLYSNPNRFSDQKYNRSMIKKLIHRTCCLKSNFKTLDTNLDDLKLRLMKNGYNKRFLTKMIKDTVESIYIKTIF